MLAEPMMTPRVVSDVFSVLALNAVSAASQIARTPTVMRSSRRVTLDAAQPLARGFRLRVERQRGSIFTDGCIDVSLVLAETPEPRVRLGMRRQVASARRGCEVDTQEPFGLIQIPIREHEGNPSVIRQSDVRR